MGTIMRVSWTVRRPATQKPILTLGRGLANAASRGIEEIKQSPWCLPFQLSQKEALSAFQCRAERHAESRGYCAPKFWVRAAQPCHVPYYIFNGHLEVTYTGIIGYDLGSERDTREEMRGRRAAEVMRSEEFKHRNLACSAQLHPGPTTAVYAGFQFRRHFLRQALSPDLSSELLQSSIPLQALDNNGAPMGVKVEAFQMKPSFAYKNRLLERMPEVAHLEAERHMQEDSVRALEVRDFFSEAPHMHSPHQMLQLF